MNQTNPKIAAATRNRAESSFSEADARMSEKLTTASAVNKEMLRCRFWQTFRSSTELSLCAAFLHILRVAYRHTDGDLELAAIIAAIRLGVLENKAPGYVGNFSSHRDPT